MALEAEKRGIVLHPMAGFSADKVISDFNVSNDYEPIAVIAAGFRDVPEKLPDDLMLREHPGARNALSSIYKLLNSEQ